MDQNSVVGQRMQRKDADAKARGKACYTGDMKFEGLLFGKALRSVYPHAKILSINTAAAEAMPGVHAVLTAKDIPGTNIFGLAIQDQPVLAQEKVRMMGDAVALVAADSVDLAEEALRKIKVEYEELPGVFKIEDALKEGAPKVHEQGNLLQHTQVRKGNVEEGFARSDLIVENIYETQRVDHAYIEPETSVAFLGDDGVLNVWTSTQYTFRDRRQIAPVVNMPVHKVRVIQMVTGGAFGGKDDITTEIQAALLAIKTGRPVKVVWSRQESMICSTKRHPMKIRIKTGATKDGMLMAVEGTVHSDKGAYCSIGHFITKKCGLHLAGPYYVPNVAVDTFAVYTNNTICGPYRGFGILQASFAHESQMDILAEKLGISPLEIRMKNALRPGLTNATGQTFEHGLGFYDTLLKAKEHMEAYDLEGGVSRVKKRGRGIGCNLYGVGYGFNRPDHSAAYVEVADDGTVTVLSGACDLGQGSDTVLCQIAAEELGISYEDVRIISADTAVTPDALASTASRQTYVSGCAVQRAAADVKQHFLKLAADIIKCEPVDIVIKDGIVSCKIDERKALKFSELAQQMHQRGKQFIGFAFYDNTTADVDPVTNQGDAYAHYIYGSQVADVEVDTETGEVTVLRIGAAQDCGKAINPKNVEQQIEGAVVQGMGYAIMEEIILKDGRTLTPSFTKFLIPTSQDAPEIVTYIVEDPDPKGPFGAKGLGEGPIIPTAAAIVNAVYDAIGVRITSLPITPEKILEELTKQSML